MYKTKIRNLVLFAFLMAFSISALAQNDSTANSTGNEMNTGITTRANNSSTTSVRPFSGGKGFRKFSIGINAGALNPSVAIGGSNDFTNPRTTLGYGANIKYQLTHYLAAQVDFVRGNLKGNQDDPLWQDGGPPSTRNVSEFDTELHYGISGGAVITFGNINWLSARSRIVPYVSAGAGLLAYDVRIIPRGSNQQIDYLAKSNVCAAIGRGQMQVLGDRVKQRRKNFGFYYSNLKDYEGISFLAEPGDAFSNRWLTTILVDPINTKAVTRENLRLLLAKENIESRPLWKPMHLQPVFSTAHYFGGIIAEKIFEKGLCLPSGSNLAQPDKERIISIIKQALKNN